MLTFHTPTPLLINLHFTLHHSTATAPTSTNTTSLGSPKPKTHKFPPTTFAADLLTDTPALFLRSLDTSCLERIRNATRYTAYRFSTPVNYEVERAFVWAGVGDEGMGCVGMRGLSEGEMEAQVRMVRERGRRDWVRVEMVVEIGGEC